MNTNFINASMELPVLVIMTVLFSACLLKKKRNPRQNLLLVIIGVDMALLLCDLELWLCLGDPEKLTAIRVLWGANYLLTYTLIVLFHYFMLAVISGKAYISKTLYFIAIPLAVLVTVAYFSSYNTGALFYLDSNGEFIRGELNWVSQVIRSALLIIDTVITLLYCKNIGKLDTARMLFYEIVTIACLLIDGRYRSILINLVISLLILIDYISVSIEQDVLIAKQKQHMAEQEKKLADERTKIMISQIQPHFLYNVISSIMSFCKEDPDKAVNALADFSDYLRANMRSLSQDTPIPFSKELEHIKTYIRLEKFRFVERLNIKYEIGYSDFFLPSLSLQPLVENAVKHGIGQKPNGGTVTLKTHLSDDGIVISVEDDGIGFDSSDYFESKEYNNSDHIGIMNVRSRIASMCNGELKIESEQGKGTVVTVFLPNNGQMS